MANKTAARRATDSLVWLEGVTFPVGKADLLQHTRDMGEMDIASVVGRLENRDYESVEALCKALSRLDSETTPEQEVVDISSKDSFPASDPPGYAGESHVGAPARKLTEDAAQ